MRALLLIALIMIGLAGCTSQSAPPFPPAVEEAITYSDKAKLIISRTSELAYMGVQARIELNGRRVTALGRSQSFKIVSEPGLLTISADAWSTPGRTVVSFTAEPGKTYMIEVSPNSGSVWAGAVLGIVGQAIEGNGPFQIVVKDAKALD